MANRKDITGNTYGYLTAMEYDHFDGKNSYWKFRCKCGNTVVRSLEKLRRAKTPSCGCYMVEIRQKAHQKREDKKKYSHCNAKRNRNLEGETFGNLFVVKLLSEQSGIDAEYLCKCNCGRTLTKTQKYLINPTSKLSCGCDRKNVSPGFGDKNRERLLKIYRGMIDRCYNSNSDSYKYYGGKGVIISRIWLKEGGFEKFYQWAINNGYANNLSIDRINPNGNYTPHNCRWADAETQANNKTNNIHIEIDGEILSVKSFCDKFNLTNDFVYKIVKDDCIFSGDYILSKKQIRSDANVIL